MTSLAKLRSENVLLLMGNSCLVLAIYNWGALPVYHLKNQRCVQSISAIELLQSTRRSLHGDAQLVAAVTQNDMQLT